MRYLTTTFALILATPAYAAKGPFLSLFNTDFVVLISFLLFIGVLVYLKVPSLLAGMLDKRANTIEAELNEAKSLREEAQALLASYERKQKEVQDQADRIVANAKEEAENAAKAAKDEIKASVKRRLAAAEEQIASAQSAAVKDVRDQAITVAVSAARNVMAKQMDDAAADGLINDAIHQVETRLN